MSIPCEIKLIEEGIKSKGPCPKCKAIKNTTYLYKPYKLENGQKIPQVLQGFCDTCGTTCTLPPQSTPKIKKFLEQKSVSLDVRIPALLEDALFKIGYEHKVDFQKVFTSLIKFYSQKILEDKSKPTIHRLLADIRVAEISGKSKGSRISMKISLSFEKTIHTLAKINHFNKSELINRILSVSLVEIIEGQSKRNAEEYFRSLKVIA